MLLSDSIDIARNDSSWYIQWMCERIRKDRWSIDGCVGAARLMKSFPGGTIPCTKTLYNILDEVYAIDKYS